jgi:hypothetical protein
VLLHHLVASADGVRLSLYAKAEVDPRCGTGLCLATDGATLLVGLSGGWLLRLSWAGERLSLLRWEGGPEARQQQLVRGGPGPKASPSPLCVPPGSRGSVPTVERTPHPLGTPSRSSPLPLRSRGSLRQSCGSASLRQSGQGGQGGQSRHRPAAIVRRSSTEVRALSSAFSPTPGSALFSPPAGGGGGEGSGGEGSGGEGGGVVALAASAGLRMTALVGCGGQAALLLGAAAVAAAAAEEEEEDGALRLLQVQRRGARCVVLCSTQRLAAVGGASGEVCLYALPPPEARRGAAARRGEEPAGEEPAPPLRRLSLSAWGESLLTTGGVSCLAFAPDGAGLAVGWRRRGAAIFGPAGTLCAAWPEPSVAAPVALGAGVAALAWGSAGSRLFVAEAGGGDGDGDGDGDGVGGVATAGAAVGGVRELSLLLACSPPCGGGVACSTLAAGGDAIGDAGGAAGEAGRGAAEAAPLLLLGAEHVHIARAAAGPRATGAWTAVPLPAAYVQRCSPLRLAALSPSGAHLAVAGRQGAALTSLDAPRWRFFGASGGAAEASMRAAALCWLGADALLLVGHAPPKAEAPSEAGEAGGGRRAALPPAAQQSGEWDGPGAAVVLLVLPRHALHLRSALARLAPASLRGKVWGCARPSAARLVVGAGRHIALLQMEPKGCLEADASGAPGSLRVAASVLRLFELDPISISISPHVSQHASLPALLPAGLSAAAAGGSGGGGEAGGGGGAEMQASALEIVVRLQDGAVMRGCVGPSPLDVRPGGMGGAVAAEPPPEPLRLQPLLPAGAAVLCWHARGALWALSGRGELCEWRWDGAEPSGVRPEGLQLLSAQPEVLPLRVLPAVWAVLGVRCVGPHAPQPVAQPFLHRHLARLLRDATHDATRDARAPRAFRRRHCLELLLHEAVLATPSATGGASAAAPLETVAALLLELRVTVRCRVVAGCARKTDALHWARLFGACGTPLALLRASLGGGDPACAAMLLLPVQHAHGDEACRDAAREVDRAAAERDMTALQRQLGAFLHRSTECD